MFCRRRDDYPLADTTWAYPYTGFWVTHALGLFGVGYMGYLIGKNMRD